MLLRLRPLLAPVLLLASVTAFYWPITLTKQYDLMWSSDAATQVWPWLQTAARQWQAHIFPLWDPHLWRGQPLLGQAQPGIAYPPNWLLFSIPLQDGYLSRAALHWYFVAIHWMAAMFSYLLCRDLGLRVLPSLLGGLAYSLSCFMAAITWPQMLNGAVWIPLIFLFLFRAAQNPVHLSSAALSGLFMGLGWLSGHHQVPLYTALAVAGTWLYYLVPKGKLNWRLASQPALAFVVCGLIGALQIVPTLEYGRIAKRWVNGPEAVGWNQPVPYVVHNEYSLPPSSLFSIALPVHKGIGTDPFLGLAIVTLAVLGLTSYWPDVRLRILAVIAVGAVLYAFGARNVFHGILYAVVPVLEKARTPAMAVVLLGFGGSVLAAAGLNGVMAGEVLRQWLRVVKALVVLSIGLCLTTFALYLAGITFDETLVISSLVAIALAGLLAARRAERISARSAAVLMLLLLFFELGTKRVVIAHESDETLMKDLNAMRSNQDLAAWLRAQPGAFRINFAADTVPENWAAYHGLETQTGYLASVTENHLAAEFHTDAMNALFGGVYTIAKQPTQVGQREVFTGASGLKIFENVHAFPRAWVVHRTERAGSRWDINLTTQQNLQAMRTTAFLTGPEPSLQSGCTSDGETVRLLRSAQGTVGFEADLKCDGMVVISETYVPGWNAEIDGRPARVWEVNGSMRGVLVPAGSHRVTMEYRPASVFVGAALSASGLLLVVGLAWWDWRRSRKTNRKPDVRFAGTPGAA